MVKQDLEKCKRCVYWANIDGKERCCNAVAIKSTGNCEQFKDQTDASTTTTHSYTSSTE